MPTTWNNPESFLLEGTLRLVSQHWRVLGVQVEADPAPHAAVDVESLLWCTLGVGRFEPRLFEQVEEWLATYSKYVNIGRLKLIGPAGRDIRWPILLALAGKLKERTRDPKWQVLLNVRGGGRQNRLDRPTPLFLNARGEELGVSGQVDPVFESRGLLRPPYSPKPQTGTPRLEHPAALLLRSRSLFGGTARGFVWAALFTREGGYQTGIADQIGYQRARVGRILKEFVESGTCREEPDRTALRYSLVNPEGWRDLLGLGFVPAWPNWRNLFDGLVELSRAWATATRHDLTPYLRASAIRRAYGEVRGKIVGSGIPVRTSDPAGSLADGFLERFEVYLRDVLKRSLFLEEQRREE